MTKLSSALSLLGWDQHTHMPKKGATARAETIGKLSKMLFERATADELGSLIETLEGDTDLIEAERASVRVVGKEYRRRKPIPPSFVEEYSAARSQAQAVWVTAREASDFSIFQPILMRMVEYARRLADYYGYEEDPYDALLEGYETGMTCERLREIMEPLRSELVPFIRRLKDEGTPPNTAVLDGDFPIDTQRELARHALELVGYDFDAGALDDVAHPFCTTISAGDVRVNNRYFADRFESGLFGALHEGGHALYNQGMPDDLHELQLAQGSSNGIHESQSRLIENQIGRSRPFWRFFQPIITEHFPQFASASAESLYRAVNAVRPSFIRVEADEVTYNLHIMLRFELETGLLNGSIRVADLPRLWNEAMEEYLGVVPPDAALGVLQDVHWSMGYFGYFPSYMLGNLYAAQIFATLRDEVPTLNQQVESGDLSVLLDWLRSKVHSHGAIYDPTDLIERISGKPLDPSYFVRYVVEKYTDIYQL